MGRRFVRYVLGTLVLALFCTACPADPICLDCLMTGGNPCGEFQLTGTIKSGKWKEPKVLVKWTDKGSGQVSSYSVGTPVTSEPWVNGTTLKIGITAANFPAGMCNIPTNGPAPYGAWKTATISIRAKNDSGVDVEWDVGKHLSD